MSVQWFGFIKQMWSTSTYQSAGTSRAAEAERPEPMFAARNAFGARSSGELYLAEGAFQAHQHPVE
jgi:hypothetical protein